MTLQWTDQLTIDGESFAIIGDDGSCLFTARDHGDRPDGYAKALYRG